MRLINHICIFLISAMLTASAAGRIEVIGPDKIDFGEYNAWKKRTARYRIRNKGNSKLEILKVRKTCGCATAKINKTVLNPGERTVLEVIILPSSIFGPYSKHTYIESTDIEKKFLRLTVAGNAVPLVEVKPDNFFYAGRIPENKAWSQSFVLKPTQPGVTLGNLKTRSNHPVQVLLKNDEKNGDSQYLLDVRLKPTTASGDLKCAITIPILSPSNHPPLTVSIEGKMGNELNAIPGTLHLPLSSQPVKKQFYLRVLGQADRVLQPHELVLPDNKNISFDVQKNSRGNGLTVNAIFSAEFTKRLMGEEKIFLSLSVPGTASARIVCKTRK